MENFEKESSEAAAKEPNYLKIGIVVGLLVIAAWVITYFVTINLPDEVIKAGERGDLFGSINALFSGLAFAALIVTLIMQNRELQLQRKELIAARQVAQQGLQEQKITNRQAQKSYDLKRKELLIITFNNLLSHHANMNTFLWEAARGSTEIRRSLHQKLVDKYTDLLLHEVGQMDYDVQDVEELVKELREKSSHLKGTPRG